MLFDAEHVGLSFRDLGNTCGETRPSFHFMDGKTEPCSGHRSGAAPCRARSVRTASRAHRSVATARSRACAFWFVQLAHSYSLEGFFDVLGACSDARWHPTATGGMTQRRRPKATEQEVCFLLPACHSYLIPTAGRPILS